MALATAYCLLIVYGHRHQVNGQQSPNKIGLAPHDRPACQLPALQLANQQRRLSTGSSSLDKLPSSLDLSGPDLSSLMAATNSSSTSAQQYSINHKLKQQQQQFDSSERLRLLRGLLTQNNYDAYLVTPNDEHGSEYVADQDRRLKFISGFGGSAGYALVLLDRAVLFTDGRYALQADQDLDCNWWLVVGDDPLADIHLWLKANAAQGIRLTASARLMSMQAYDYLDEQIRSLGSKFDLMPLDLIDEIHDKLSTIYDLSGASAGVTATGGAATSVEPLSVHPIQFNGNISWQEKVVKLVESMNKLKVAHYVITQLDEVAWLLNLRGNDIPQSPLFKAFIMLSVRQPGSSSSSSISGLDPQQLAAATTNNKLAASGNKVPLNPVEQLQQTLQQQQQQSTTTTSAGQFVRLSLFVDLRKIDQQVWDHLRVNNISVVQQRLKSEPNSSEQQQNIVTTRIQVDLEDYNSFLREFGERLGPKQLQGKLLLNARANVAIHALAKDHADRLVLVESLVQKLKAVKSDGEVQGMRLAHWRDSLAISMLLAQLDQDIGAKKQTQKWTEVSAARELEFYRSLMDYNRGQSFDSISAYGPNGAIVHYRPNYESAPAAAAEQQILIGNQSTYLLDCGGQYLDGTTDISRTLHFGEPSEFQRETYTRVLMGAIDMMSLIFDQPLRSPYRLGDLLARRHLFELGLDYAHGTGHGVGLYSLVHEAPALIEHYSNFANAKQQQQQRTASLGVGAGAGAVGAAASGGKNGAGGGGDSASGAVENQPILLQPNMFTSVEPGYYKANDFGIRLENIVVTQRVQLKSSLSRPNDRWSSSNSEQRQFLRFEPISLVPFEPKLIKFELLSNKQKTWLNSYNLMVRLRMTQQINHYLAKIRSAPSSTAAATTAAATVRGVSSSSHLLSAASSASRDNSSSGAGRVGDQLGQNNYLRLDSDRLQEKLEQTHKWIMAKTELIPLDVPQSLIAAVHRRPSASAPMFGRKQQQPATAADHQDPMNGQRLMLAYMSSMPFNDAEASQAIASLNLQQQQQQQRLLQLEARAENATGSNNDAGQDQSASANNNNNNNNKCYGFECDIWLVSALNSHPSSSSAGAPPATKRASSSPSSASLDGWPEMNEQSFLSSSSSSSSQSKLSGGELASTLFDLFSLKSESAAGAHSASGLSLASLWPIAILSLIVVLQLGIMALMCSHSGGRSGKLRLRPSGTNGGGRRRNWCPNASDGPEPRSAGAASAAMSELHAEVRQESMA